jgi:hypothetical protein
MLQAPTHSLLTPRTLVLELILLSIFVTLFLQFSSLFHLPSLSPTTNVESTRPLRYAALGDSWASGVNWGPPSADVEYDFPSDSEVCRCRRVNEAYPAQLAHDPDSSWRGGRDVDLSFQACHGAFFDAIVDQVSKVNGSWFGGKGKRGPDFATLMVGGNDAGFQAIVEDCVYQFDRERDYGPEYPDHDGECAKTLALSRETIRSETFRAGLLGAVNAIMSMDGVWENQEFRLYVLSYAGLFNHDDEACDEWTFGVWPGHTPRLRRELRRAVNEVIDEGRRVYEHVINHVLFNPKVRYLDVNSLFDGHRFCEPTEERTIEAMRLKSWLYSLEWPGCIPLAGDSDDVDELQRNWPEWCRKCGGMGELGELQRPFHPKGEAHGAIKQFLISALNTNFVPL